NQIAKQSHRKPEVGEIEIYGSGDDLRRISPDDGDGAALNLKDREIILVDDVIFTGRTVKSALSIIFRSARPQSVRLAVLIDRGHREVPVKPNYVGKHIPSSEADRVRVKLRDLDPGEHDQVVIYTIINPAEEPRRSTGEATALKRKVEA
ncbi:MAG TPA: phosphoribosyltransferase family protein, partial [Candidatus Binatia bacterium]|nr:phosphoribosyltransferase family protein [Candidatus Binatia bacterium]